MRGILLAALALGGATAALTVTPAGAADDAFVLQVGRIVPIEGDPFDKASVYVAGGQVREIREGHVNPWDAAVIDRRDEWLLPGMVEAHSQGGLDRGNEQAPNTPFVSVLDGLDPLSSYYEDLLRDGVTTVFVVPGDATLIGGQGLVLKPVGRTAEEMIVRRDAGLKIALSPRSGTSRMAQFAELVAALDGARDGEASRVAGNPDAAPRSPRAEAFEALLAKRLPAVMSCNEAVDVRNALRLMDDYGLEGFLTLGAGARRAFPTIRERGVACVLPADLEPVVRNPETGREERRLLARECRDAGVPVVVQASESSPYGMRSLWYQAAVAVSQGLTRDEALRAVTLNPATVLGVDDRVGSVAAGKDANLVTWSGDPLDPMNHVVDVWVEGELVYERRADRRLQRLLEGASIGRKDEQAPVAPSDAGDETGTEPEEDDK